MIDRLKELSKTAYVRRLGTGSAYLGEAWHSGHRCRGGWTGACPCGSEATPFCQGKLRWIGILLELHDGRWPYGLTGQEDFAVIETMTVSQFEASGLTALVQVPGAEQPIRILPDRLPVPYQGKNQTKYWLRSSWLMLQDLALTEPGEERESALAAVQKTQKVMV